METNVILDKQQSSTHRTPASASEASGLMPSVVGAGVDLAGVGVRTTVGLLGEVRGQTLAATTQGIDFAEQLVHGVCDLGRRSARRVDQAVGDALGAVERVALAALGALRSTTDQAARLAMSVAEGTVGPRRPDGSN